jgi:hypothetical protein
MAPSVVNIYLPFGASHTYALFFGVRAIDRSQDAIDLKLIDEINVLKNDIQRLTIEAEHKDEVTRIKDDKIKRIENMARYYVWATLHTIGEDKRAYPTH